MPRARAIALVVLASTLASAPASGQVEWTGYAKTLGVWSRSAVDDSPYVLDLTRLRLQGAAERGDVRAEVWFDTEVLAGSWFDVPEAQLLDSGILESTAGEPSRISA